MTARVPATDRSVSWRHQDCSYYTRSRAGREYAQLLRDFDIPCRPSTGSAGTGVSTTETASQLLLDANALADDSGYLELGLTLVSPDDRLLAYSVDRDRRRGLRAALPRPRHRRGPGRRGAAQLLRRRLERRLGALLLHRARRRLPAVPGVAAPARHPGRRRRAGARGARRAVRARACAATRSGGLVRDLVGEPGHQRGLGRRRPRPDVGAALGRRPAARAWSTTPSTPCCPTARTRCCWSPTTTPRSSGWPGAPVPRDADQDHAAWAPVRPEDPSERLERVDAFAGHVVLSFRVRRPAPAARAADRRRSPPTASSSTRRSTAGTLDARPTTSEYDVDRRSPSCDQSYVHPPVWSDVDLRTGERTERHRKEAPGHDPAAYVSERRSLPGPRRHPGAGDRWSGTATPRSTAPRPRCSTATAPTSTA